MYSKFSFLQLTHLRNFNLSQSILIFHLSPYYHLLSSKMFTFTLKVLWVAHKSTYLIQSLVSLSPQYLLICQPSQSSQPMKKAKLVDQNTNGQDPSIKTQSLNLGSKQLDWRRIDQTQYFQVYICTFRSIHHKQLKQMSEKLKEIINNFLEKYEKGHDIHHINHGIGPVIPSYDYKGTLEVPQKPLFGYQISALFYQEIKQGQFVIGNNYSFSGGVSPLELTKGNKISVKIQGTFFSHPSSFQGHLNFDLAIKDGTFGLVLFDKSLIVRGAFAGNLLGSKLVNNVLGSGTFQELWLLEPHIEKIRKNIEEQKDVDAKFYDANKHILNSQKNQIYPFQADFDIPAIKQIKVPKVIYGYFYKITPLITDYSFYADQQRPHHPDTWPKLINPLKFKGAFFLNPDSISNSINYSIITRDGQLYLTLFSLESKALIGEFVADDSRPINFGAGWFQKGRK